MEFLLVFILFGTHVNGNYISKHEAVETYSSELTCREERKVYFNEMVEVLNDRNWIGAEGKVKVLHANVKCLKLPGRPA